ncbi:Uncharacterised protein [Mycobacterium tuberculosis]|nr:Uncharacterised protein [Mycobacterium tuberculosis]
MAKPSILAAAPGGVLARLDEINQQRAAAQTDVMLATEGHAESRRDLADAERALTAYHAACGAGERQPNPDTERDLIDAVERIRGRLRPTGPGGELEDVAVTAKVDRLKAEVNKHLQTEREFITAHRDEILAELLDGARAQREAARAALVALRKAANAWDGPAGRFNVLAGPLGINPRDIPSNPLRDAVDMLRARLEMTEQKGRHLLMPFPYAELPADELGGTEMVATPWGYGSNPHRRPARRPADGPPRF